MSQTQKITVHVPEELLATARRVTGKGVTATIIEALQEIQRREERSALLSLQGQVAFDIDLEKTRQ